MSSDGLDVVIITGMSGAGKTVAMQSFEDLGYFCIDNMPPSLLKGFWELVKTSGKVTRVALVIDLRSRAFFDEIMQSIIDFNNADDINMKILFLDSSDSALVSRYKETRRKHPLMNNEKTLTQAIQNERYLLRNLKSRAKHVIDTTSLSPRQLREHIMAKFKQTEKDVFTVQVMSFGFKYGMPIEADLVMDVRFLPNPYYIPELKELTGTDEPVYDFVMSQPETEEFFKKYTDLVSYVLPSYRKEGKLNVVIAIGCTGGQHRSVALAQRLGEYLTTAGYTVSTTHRDKNKRKETVNRS